MRDSGDAQMTSAALQFIRATLLEAGRLALALRSNLGDVLIKGDETPVSKLDREIEALLTERICREYPGHRILAEEGGISGGDSEFTWAIDPLDGTRAFVSGLPMWGISVGLLKNEQPLVGGVYLPKLSELYWGDGQSAFLNDQFLLPPVVSLNSRFAFLAVPSNSHLLYDINFGRLRSLGSVTAHLVYVARGAAIGALTRRVKAWDVAGVLPILRHLNIELRYLSGAPFYVRDLLGGQSAIEPIVAAPMQLITPLLALIQAKPLEDTALARKD